MSTKFKINIQIKYHTASTLREKKRRKEIYTTHKRDKNKIILKKKQTNKNNVKQNISTKLYIHL